MLPERSILASRTDEFVKTIGHHRQHAIAVTKLKEKGRLCSRTKRVHDDPQTPYAHALASPGVSEADKAEL
jgi:hypothetical protein